MTSGTFQSLPVPTTALDGRISAVVLDPDGSPVDVVRNGAAIKVQTEWHLTGFLVPLIGGAWSVHVSVDEIGGTHDFTTPPQLLQHTGADGYSQQTTLTNLKPGSTYALIASLGYRTPAGGSAALGGYVNIGTVNVLS